MVKFEAEGQGFFDFISENCCEKFVAEVKRDLDYVDLNAKIIDVKVEDFKDYKNKIVIVYLQTIIGPIIHEVFYLDSGPPLIRRYNMPIYYLEELKKMGAL